MNDPEVSVIVPVFRHWNDLEICLNCLECQDFPSERFEVIVINNDPNTPPPETLNPTWYTLLDESNPGSYAARNTGLDVAKGAILAFTDADCQPESGWLTAIAQHFEDRPDSRRVGGAIRVLDDPQAEPLAQLHDNHFALRQEGYVSHGWAATANMAARKDVFDQIGDFDADQKSGGDSLWGRRAKAAGIPITYLGSAVVGHPPRRTVSDILSKHRRLAGGKLDKRKRKRSLFALRLDFVIRTPFRLLPRISVFRRVAASGLKGAQRRQMLILLHRIKWAEWAERGRLLFSSSGSQRH